MRKNMHIKKNVDGDSRTVRNALASRGRWKPGASTQMPKITPELQAEKDMEDLEPVLVG